MGKKNVIVEWFDELKGIGEGKSSDGKTVFLNSRYIVPSSGFITLKAGEATTCEVQILDNKCFASSIVRYSEKPAVIEKTTFLEPAPLEGIF